MSLGNSSYLRHLTRNKEIHSGETYYGIYTTLNPKPIGTERGVLAESKKHGISGHFINQPKCYLTSHHYLKPSYPTLRLRRKPRLQHDCLEITDKVYFSRSVLVDQPLTEPGQELYTDGSNFMRMVNNELSTW